MVIVIMAIISSVGIVRFWGNNKDFQARQFADETISALRYAQKLAISSGCHIQVNLDVNDIKIRQRDTAGGCTDTSNTVYIDVIDPTSSTTTEYPKPANVSWKFYSIDNDTGVQTENGPFTFYYDTLGRPVDSGNTPYRNQKIKIDIGTGLTNVFIESETGFVHL